MTDAIYSLPGHRVWQVRHFPFLQLVEYLAGAGAFYLLGCVLAGMDISIVFACIVWTLGFCVLLPILGLQRTRLLLDRENNTLMIVWQAWWGGMQETRSCQLDAIEMIRLCDMRKTYRNGEDFVHGVTLHNWRLWAVVSGEEQVPLIPLGHGSGLFDRRLGERLARSLGVDFRKEIWEMPT